VLHVFFPLRRTNAAFRLIQVPERSSHAREFSPLPPLKREQLVQAPFSLYFFFFSLSLSLTTQLTKTKNFLSSLSLLDSCSLEANSLALACRNPRFAPILRRYFFQDSFFFSMFNEAIFVIFGLRLCPDPFFLFSILYFNLIMLWFCEIIFPFTLKFRYFISFSPLKFSCLDYFVFTERFWFILLLIHTMYMRKTLKDAKLLLVYAGFGSIAKNLFQF
jgi:hypothetical protein